jgi:Dienelactone hydrolase family
VSDGIGRFLYQFLRARADASREQELLFDVGGERRSATLYLPRRLGGRSPAWILLHGVTVPGRHHEAVRRMGRALSAAGHLAFVPEVPSWTALRVEPREAEPTVRAALAALRGRPDVDASRVGLMGFSVAGTWALEVAAAEPRPALHAVVSFGGYGDLRRMVRAMLTGEHEWQGRPYRYRPEPYGRWIVGADLLPLVEGGRYGAKPEREAAARALRQLAHTSGRNGAAAYDPVYDPLIAQLGEAVPAGAREAWRLLAPPSTQPVPDRHAGRELADALAEAGLRAHPDLDPGGRLDGLAASAILVHGRGDTLVPFTETLRLAALLPRTVRRHVTITRLIGHTKTGEAGPPRSPVTLAREASQAGRAVRAILRSLGA